MLLNQSNCLGIKSNQCHAIPRNLASFERHRLWTEEQERLYLQMKLINGVRAVLKPVTVNGKFYLEFASIMDHRYRYIVKG